jgi:hypothetical protein
MGKKKNTKTKAAKLKIAAHQSTKGRGSKKKSARVRKREADIEAEMDAIEAGKAALKAASR